MAILESLAFPVSIVFASWPKIPTGAELALGLTLSESFEESDSHSGSHSGSESGKLIPKFKVWTQMVEIKLFTFFFSLQIFRSLHSLSANISALSSLDTTVPEISNKTSNPTLRPSRWPVLPTTWNFH